MNLNGISKESGRAETARPASTSVKRFTGGCLLAFLMGIASGCYTYSPMPPAAGPGTDVVLGLNDQGRVSLGQSVGPAAQSIEGTLQSNSDSAFVVSVSSVTYFNGGSNKWSGEPLTIGRSLVNDVKERQFSRSKTTLVVGAAAGALIAFILSRSLMSSGNPEKQPNPPPPVGQ